MKKLIVILMLIFVASLVGCFSNSTMMTTTTPITPTATKVTETTQTPEATEAAETAEATIPTEFPEADPYSKNAVDFYINQVKTRDFNNFLSSAERTLLEESGFSVHGNGLIIYRFSWNYLADIVEMSHPLIFSYKNSLLLWATSAKGELYIEELGVSYNEAVFNNPFRTHKNVHYTGNNKIIDTTAMCTYVYNDEGSISFWILGEEEDIFPAPVEAIYRGYNDGLFIFQKEDKAYEVQLGFGNNAYCYCISENVKMVLTTNYKYEEKPALLLLMEDNSLMAVTEVYGWDECHFSEFHPIT